MLTKLKILFLLLSHKRIPVKVWIVIFFLLTLIFSHFSVYIYGKQIEKAYQKEKIELARKAFESKLEKLQVEKNIIIENLKQSETKVIEVIREIQVDVITPDCTDLGNEWLREYNRAISASSDS